MTGSAPADEDDDLGLIGISPAICRLRSQIRLAAQSSAPVLITGESGTGKELVATALHKLSKRCAGPILRVNCGALKTELLESELFGHEKGAFTGADVKRKGMFEVAAGGTIFLDEINSTDASFQVKLLRVVDNGTVTPVGSSISVEVEVRIVAASNQNLEEEVAAGRFRADLFHRINVLSLQVPALRDRDDDVLLLSEHFVRIYCAEEGKESTPLSNEFQQLLKQQKWPGNVRELKNIIQRAVVFADDRGLNIPLEVSRHSVTSESVQDANTGLIADLVFDDLLRDEEPLKGLLQGDKNLGPAANAVISASLEGLARYLASDSGQELLARKVGAGHLMERFGMNARKPGNESEFNKSLRQGIVEVYNSSRS